MKTQRVFSVLFLPVAHKLERDLDGVRNANCMIHARSHFANAIKAIGKSNPKTVEASIAYKALVRIGTIYDLNVYCYMKHLLTELTWAVRADGSR